MFNVFLIFCGCDNFREIRGNSRNMFPFVTVNTVHDMREYVLYGETIGELLNYFFEMSIIVICDLMICTETFIIDSSYLGYCR